MAYFDSQSKFSLN